MKKIGYYTGKEYTEPDDINECCFNAPSWMRAEEIETAKKQNKEKCIMCAISHGYREECEPCKVMSETENKASVLSKNLNR